MTRFLVIIFLSLGIFACGNSVNNEETAAEIQEQDAAFAKVMEAHDIIMPKMADISRARRALKKYLNDESLNDIAKAKIKENIDALEAADEAMMTWMSNINSKKPNKLRDTKTHAQIMDILAEEQKAIDKVQVAMETNIVAGEMMLSELEGE